MYMVRLRSSPDTLVGYSCLVFMIYLAVLLAAGLLYFAAVAPAYFADHAPIVMGVPW